MSFRIAWDHDPENPNPHALSVEDVDYPTEQAASAAAEAELREQVKVEGYREDELAPWTIVEVRAYLHPSRVTPSGPDYVTGLLPKCPECPLVEGHEGEHLTNDADALAFFGRGLAEHADTIEAANPDAAALVHKALDVLDEAINELRPEASR